MNFKKFKSYCLLCRPKTLIASIAPVLIGAGLVDREFSPFIFLLILSNSILLQILANATNDLFDGLKGSDQNRVGPKRMIASKELSISEVKNFCFLITLLNLFIGYFLVIHAGILILLIGLLAIIFAYLYTATKYALAYLGLGEILVVFFFGLIPTIGTIYILNPTQVLFTFKNIVFSIAPALMSIGILTVNNLRDFESDLAANKRTLIVRFGTKFGIWEYQLALALAVLMVFFYLLVDQRLTIFLLLIPSLLFNFSLIYKINFKKDYINFLEPTAKASVVLSISLLIILILI